MATRRRFENGQPAFRLLSRPGVVQLPDSGPVESANSGTLKINVVFTDLKATEAALKRAVDLAVDLEAETRIIVPQLVAFPLPLEEPAVPVEFTCDQIRHLAGSVGADPYVDVFLCRDRIDLLLTILRADSLVVIGTRKRWFPTKAERMARILRNNGCEVLLARYR